MKKLVAKAILGLFWTTSGFSFTLGSFQKGWASNDLKVNLNPTNCPADIVARLEDSFKLWNSVPTSALKLSMGNTNSATTPTELDAGDATDTPLVTCSTNFEVDSRGAPPATVSGVGFTRGLSDNPNILYGGVILNVQPGAPANISNQTETQRAVIVAHELGHMLGLGHSGSEPALMYYTAGIKSNLSLSKDDWDGISYLYPRDEAAQSQLLAGCAQVRNITGASGFGGDFLFTLTFLFSLAFIFIRSIRRHPASLSI